MKIRRPLNLAMAVMFLVCLFEMPYGYYQLIRLIGMAGFALIAYDAFRASKMEWTIFFIASAILINPLEKIALGRELWNVVDVIWAIVLVYLSFQVSSTPTAPQERQDRKLNSN